jgi:O-antigen ligase
MGAILKPYKEFAGTIARWSVVLLCFSLATSRSLFSLGSALIFAGLMLEGDWQGKWQRLKHNVPALTVAALVAWFYASGLWTQATANTLEYASNVHWKLLLIPAIVILVNDERWRDRCWSGFGAGMLVLLAHVYALVFVDLSWTSTQKPDAVFFNPLSQSVGLAIFCGWCLLEFLSTPSRKKKVGLSIVFLLASLAVLNISQQRLGYLMWIAACLTVVLTQLKNAPKLRAWSVLAIFGVFVAVFISNERMQTRFELVVQEIQNYQFENNHTSVGSRLHMWYSSIGFIRNEPLIGHGIGAYPVVSEAHFQDPDMCLHGCRHPHNQYLFYAVEFGLVGLGLFLLMLYKAWARYRFWEPANTMPVVVLLVFMLSGLVESTLWYRGFFYLFVPLLALSIVDQSKSSVEPPGESS